MFLLGAFLVDFHVEFVVSFFFYFFLFREASNNSCASWKIYKHVFWGWVGSLSNSNNLLQLLLLDFSIIAKHKKNINSTEKIYV